MRPRKITLGQAKRQGDTILLFHCETTPCHEPGNRNGFCFNKGKMALDEAIGRWGDHMRLDQVPARCARCGRRDAVNVRSYHPAGPGGFPIGEGPF